MGMHLLLLCMMAVGHWVNGQWRQGHLNTVSGIHLTSVLIILYRTALEFRNFDLAIGQGDFRCIILCHHHLQVHGGQEHWLW